MGPGDLQFFCNKIINKWITTVVFTYFIASLCIVFFIGFVICLILLLFIEYYSFFTYDIYYYLGAISIFVFIVIFLLSIKFELQVLFNLKKFIEQNAINLISNNRIDTVTRYLEDICKYLVKSPIDITELSRRVNSFKNLKYKKEDR